MRKPLAQVLEGAEHLNGRVGTSGFFLMVERGYIVNLFHVEKLEDE